MNDLLLLCHVNCLECGRQCFESFVDLSFFHEITNFSDVSLHACLEGKSARIAHFILTGSLDGRIENRHSGRRVLKERGFVNAILTAEEIPKIKYQIPIGFWLLEFGI